MSSDTSDTVEPHGSETQLLKALHTEAATADQIVSASPPPRDTGMTRLASAGTADDTDLLRRDG